MLSYKSDKAEPLSTTEGDRLMNAKMICASVALGTLMTSSLALADSGPFTKQQAEKGHPTFNTLCAQCHRPNLQGALGPSLVDDKFKAMFAGKPLANLRDYVYQNMPKNAPKSIKPEQLDPIVAWILKNNGIEPGDKELSEESAKSAQFPKK